jgi:hypothetical protein
MSAWLLALVTPSRFRRIERSCKWTGTHDVHWTRMNHGRVLVGQCLRCRVNVGAVAQAPASDWPGCVD